MKPAGSLVGIRLVDWQGELPKVGDWLQTSTGRKYEIVEADGRKLIAVVLFNTDEFQSAAVGGARRFSFRWLPRGKRAT